MGAPNYVGPAIVLAIAANIFLIIVLAPIVPADEWHVAGGFFYLMILMVTCCICYPALVAEEGYYEDLLYGDDPFYFLEVDQ